MRKNFIWRLENVYHAYLSELDNIDTYILRYLRIGFKKGKSVDLYLTSEEVLKVHSAAKKVRTESHLMLGLLRFKKLKGAFTMPLQPCLQYYRFNIRPFCTASVRSILDNPRHQKKLCRRIQYVEMCFYRPSRRASIPIRKDRRPIWRIMEELFQQHLHKGQSQSKTAKAKHAPKVLEIPGWKTINARLYCHTLYIGILSTFLFKAIISVELIFRHHSYPPPVFRKVQENPRPILAKIS